MVPLIVDGTVTHAPRFGMVHERGRLYDETNGVVLTIPAVQQQYKERRLTESSMIMRKFIKNYNVKMTDSISEEVCRSAILNSLKEIRNFIADRVMSNQSQIHTLIDPSSVVLLRDRTFILTSKARACVSKIHKDWSSNPVVYYAFIKKADTNYNKSHDDEDDAEKFTCVIRSYCYGCSTSTLGEMKI